MKSSVEIGFGFFRHPVYSEQTLPGPVAEYSVEICENFPLLSSAITTFLLLVCFFFESLLKFFHFVHNTGNCIYRETFTVQ